MRDPLLLTPGPLTTSDEVKQAMLRDRGSRDAAFLAASDRVYRRLTALAGREDTHVTVPLQGQDIGEVVPAVDAVLREMEVDPT